MIVLVGGGGGAGDDKEAFCAAVAEHAEGVDDAMERMIENAPDTVRESLELLQGTGADAPDASAAEAARESVNLFIQNKCNLHVEI